MHSICQKINFKMKVKLEMALDYIKMETVTVEEFNKIVVKFRNYIKQGGDVEKEIRESFNKQLPQHYHKYQI